MSPNTHTNLSVRNQYPMSSRQRPHSASSTRRPRRQATPIEFKNSIRFINHSRTHQPRITLDRCTPLSESLHVSQHWSPRSSALRHLDAGKLDRYQSQSPTRFYSMPRPPTSMRRPGSAQIRRRKSISFNGFIDNDAEDYSKGGNAHSSLVNVNSSRTEYSFDDIQREMKAVQEELYVSIEHNTLHCIALNGLTDFHSIIPNIQRYDGVIQA